MKEQLIIDTNSEWVNIKNFSKLSNLDKTSFLVSISSFRINKSKEDIRNFIKYSLNQVWKDYDFDLITKDSNTLYCSELIYKGLKQIGIDIDIKRHTINRTIILPTNIVEYIIKYWIDKKEFRLIFFIEKENWKIIERKINEFRS